MREATKWNPQLQHQMQAQSLSQAGLKDGVGGLGASPVVCLWISLFHLPAPHRTMGCGVDALYNLVNGRKEEEPGRKKGREIPSLIRSSSWLSCTTCLPFGNFSLQCILSQRHFTWLVPWATCQARYSIVGLEQRQWPPTSRQDLWVHLLGYVPH